MIKNLTQIFFIGLFCGAGLAFSIFALANRAFGLELLWLLMAILFVIGTVTIYDVLRSVQ